MKKIFQLLIGLFLSLIVNAQAPALHWARSMGSNLDDFGTSSTIDAFGNIYIIGSYQGTPDFDPGPGTYYLKSQDTLSKNLFISKIDKLGHLIWAKGITGSNCKVNGVSIAVDSIGNVFVAGDWSKTVDFDPGSGIHNLISQEPYTNGFVLKLDSLGNFDWVREISGDQQDHARCLATDNFHNIYIVGDFELTVDFDPGNGVSELTAINSSDLFLLKLDNDGNFQWVKQIKSSDCRSITLSESGSIYLSATFFSTTDVDPGPGVYNLTAAGSGIYILKLDPSGNFKWALKIEAPFFNKIALNSLGELYLTGQFTGTVDFDPGPSLHNLMSKSVKGFDMYISKFDSSGNFKWVKSISSTNGIIPQSIITDLTKGDIFISGIFMGKADFNPGIGIDSFISKKDYDMFVLKLDSTGNYKWLAHFLIAEKFSFTTNAYSSLCMDDGGYIYLLGGFNNSVDFNPSAGADSLRSKGLLDIFLIKLGECFAPSTVTTKNGNTLTAKQDGAFYQWYYCKNDQADYLAIAGAVNQSYTATKSGSYAVVVSLNGCSDTSNCIQINNIGINGFDNKVSARIYPNPTNGILNVDLDVLSENSRIEVYNSYGQLVLIKELNNKNSRLNKIPLPTGLYFVKVFSYNQIITIQKIEFIPDDRL